MSGNRHSGRKRLPAEIHWLRGNYRKDRHGELPAADSNGDASELFFEPESVQAKEFFDAIMESEVGSGIRGSDSAALCVLSEIFVLLNQAVDAARKKPLDKNLRSAVCSYTAQFIQLSSRFGLTPSDRQTLFP